MIKKLAFVINQTDISQKCDLAFNCLNHIAQNTDIDVSIYRCDIGPLIKIPLFGLFNIEDLWNFNGIVFSLDVFSTQKMLICPQIAQRYFYIHDIEWQAPNMSYGPLSKIYQNSDLQLLTQNKDHQNLVQKCWNKSSKIIDSFNVDNIIKLVNNYYDDNTS